MKGALELKRVDSRGIVYIASGTDYILEACTSACSAKDTNPELPVCLICDDMPPVSHCFDEITLKPELDRGFGVKLHMWDSPFEETLFIDTDTRIVADLSDLWPVLDRFDIFAVQGGGYDYSLDNIPNTFPEYNTGVIGFRRNARVEAFFKKWKRFFDEYEAVMGSEGDQRSFRRAAWESDVRIACIPFAWNLMPYVIQAVHVDVKILHGRRDLARLAASMNATVFDKMKMGKFMPRAYVPRVGCVYHYNDANLCELFGLVLRAVWMLGIELVKRPLRSLRLRR